MTEESSQYPLSSSSSSSQYHQNPESCIQSFFNLFLRNKNTQDLTRGLQNVITQVKTCLCELISYEELSKSEATTDSDASSVTESIHDGSDLYDPFGEQIHQQAPTNDASELVFPPQSFFATFSPVSVPPPTIHGAFDSESNFKQYQLWGRPDQDQRNNNHPEDANTIDGSFYMISRKPFDPTGRRPFNPFGPIQRP